MCDHKALTEKKPKIDRWFPEPGGSEPFHPDSVLIAAAQSAPESKQTPSGGGWAISHTSLPVVHPTAGEGDKS